MMIHDCAWKCIKRQIEREREREREKERRGRGKGKEEAARKRERERERERGRQMEHLCAYDYALKQLLVARTDFVLYFTAFTLLE